MLQPDSIKVLNDSVNVLPDSLAKLDLLATADSLHLADSLKAIIAIPRGFIGIPHPSFPQTESWVFLVLMVLFFLLGYAISQSSGFITDTVKTFFQVKERSSIFSKATVNDVRFRFFFVAISVCILSLYAYLLINKSNNHFSVKEYGILLGITGLFCILKSLIFDLIGYVFLSPSLLKISKDSYFNIISILGIVLFPLLLLQIYTPDKFSSVIEIISLIICTIACVLIIIKLFQIFFRKIVDSFYILLYLCTLEFLPLIILFLVYKFVLKSV